MNYSTAGRYTRIVVLLIVIELIAHMNVLASVGFSEYSARNELFCLLFEIDFDNRSQNVISALMGLFPFMLFSFLESAAIIRDRNIGAEHIIARYSDRRRFLFHRIRGMAIKNSIYMFLSLGAYYILAAVASADAAQPSDLVFLTGFLMMFLLFIELHILLMNLLRIYLSQDKIILLGFLCYAAETACACVHIPCVNHIDPFYYLLMYWRLGWPEKIFGFFLLVFLNAAVAALMGWSVEHTDIGIRNEEL